MNDPSSPTDGPHRSTRLAAELSGTSIDSLPFGTLSEMLKSACARGVENSVTHILESDAYVSYSYSSLMVNASKILGGLRQIGIQSGDRVILQLPDPRDLLAAVWACILGGIIAVPTSPDPPSDSGVSRHGLLESIKTVVETDWAITSVHSLLQHSIIGAFHESNPDDVALLMLTSGSTGIPKAVQLTHRNIISRSAATASVRGMSARNRTMNWMPLDHVGGLVMFHLRDVFLGCNQIHAAMSWVLADPLRWIDVLSNLACDTTWASNFAFGMVADRSLQSASRKWDLSNLTYIMNGGEPISSTSVTRFVEMLAPHGLPKDAVHPGWGMSETCSGVVDTRLHVEELKCKPRFVSVGKPHPGVAVRIVDGAGLAVGEGEVGMVQVSGVPITKGYFSNDLQNRISFTDDGWFKSGDLGYISNGGLTIAGRSDDVIVSDGLELYAHEVEAAVEELSFVDSSYTVCCLVDGYIAIAYHDSGSLSGLSSNGETIKDHVFTRFGIRPRKVFPLKKVEIPKTGIGKLKRAQLAFRLSSKGNEVHLSILQLIRLKGRPLLQDIVQASAHDAENVLPYLKRAGWCEESGGRYYLTNAGKSHLEALLQQERQQLNSSRLKALYLDFRQHNRYVKTLITDWQIRDGEINDHGDEAYDSDLKAKLELVYSRFTPLLSNLSSTAPRLESYRPRFEHALNRLRSDDDRWFSGALIDSFHTIWFELHEDILGLTGISRNDEDALVDL